MSRFSAVLGVLFDTADFFGGADFFGAGFDLLSASFDLSFFALGTNGGRGQTLSGRPG